MYLSLCSKGGPEVRSDAVIQPLHTKLGKPLKLVQEECFPGLFCPQVILLDKTDIEIAVGHHFRKGHPGKIVVFGISHAVNRPAPSMHHVEADVP